MLSPPVMNIQSCMMTDVLITNSMRKLIDPQQVKKFPASYRNQRFITMFIKAHHLSLSSVSSIQSYHSQIFSSNLCLSLPWGLHPSGLPQTPYTHLSCSAQVLITISIFWDTTIHSLVDMCQHFRGTHCLIIRVEDKRQQASTEPPDCIAPHSIRLYIIFNSSRFCMHFAT
jgi:hypothetical protein